MAWTDHISETKPPRWAQRADEEREQDAMFRFSLEEASKYSPEQSAKDQANAEKLGIPLDVVRSKPEEAERYSTLSDIDSKTASANYTREFLSNPDNASLAQDDVDGMVSMEGILQDLSTPYIAFAKWATNGGDFSFDSYFKTLKAIPASIAMATAGITEGVLRQPKALGEYREAGLQNPLDVLTQAYSLAQTGKMVDAPIASSLEEIEQGVFGMPGTTEVADKIARSMDYLSENYEAFRRLGEKGQMADKAVEQLINKGDPAGLYGVLSDPEAIAGFVGQAAPSLVLAWASGGSMPFMMFLESIEISSDAADFEARTGQKIDPVMFSLAAAQAGVLGGLLEKAGFETVFRKGLSKVIPGKGPFSTIVGGALGEMTTEGVQEFNQNLAVWATYDSSRNLASGILPGMIGGFGAGGAMAALARTSEPGSDFSKDLLRAQQALQRGDLIDVAVEQSAANKLRERSKEKYRDWVAGQLGAEDSVYMAPEDARAFFQSHPEVMDALPEDASEAITEALSIGSDVEIGMADYLTYFTDFHAEIRDTLRNDMDGMTTAEANRWLETATEEFETAAEKVLEGLDQENEIRESADRVQQMVEQQLVQSGRVTPEHAKAYAAMHRSVAITIASKAGITPEQVYERFGLQVQGQQAADDMAEVIAAGFFRQLSSEEVRRTRIVTPEGEPMRLYRGRTHILPDDPGTVPGVMWTTPSAHYAGFYTTGQGRTPMDYTPEDVIAANASPEEVAALQAEMAEIAPKHQAAMDAYNKALKESKVRVAIGTYPEQAYRWFERMGVELTPEADAEIKRLQKLYDEMGRQSDRYMDLWHKIGGMVTQGGYIEPINAVVENPFIATSEGQVFTENEEWFQSLREKGYDAIVWTPEFDEEMTQEERQEALDNLPEYLQATADRVYGAEVVLLYPERQARGIFEAPPEGLNQSEVAEYVQAVAKGLPMDLESRMTRAEELGWDTSTVWYHGTRAEISDEMRRNRGGAIFLTSDPKIADEFAEATKYVGDPNVLPLYIKPENIFDFNNADHVARAAEAMKAYLNDESLAERSVLRFKDDPYGLEGTDLETAIEEAGFSGYRVPAENAVAIFDPSQIRSINAAFDPDFADSANLLAQSAVDTSGSPAIGVRESGEKIPGAKVDDVGRYLDDLYKQEFGEESTFDDADALARAADRIDAELKYQLTQAVTGKGWYDDDIHAAFDLSEQYIPGLANDPTTRDLMTVVSGILSNGNRANANWGYAIDVMRAYKETGKLATRNRNGNIFGRRGNIIGAQIEGLQNAIDDLGERAVVDFMMGMHTGRELRDFKKKYWGTESISGSVKLKESYLGARLFGPKVGPFMMALNGFHNNDAVMDVWATRTMNRHLGRMVGPEGKLREAPANNKERDAWSRIMEDVAARNNLEVRDAQAIIWYFEQQLFAGLSRRVTPESFADGARSYIRRNGGVLPGEEAGAGQGGQFFQEGIAPKAEILFEVAPDPNNKSLTEAWNRLTDEEKRVASNRVASAIAPRVLEAVGTTGNFEATIGGYEGATNPSMTLYVNDPAKALPVSRMLGFALSQDSMMVVSDSQIAGTEEVGVVTINIPRRWKSKQIAQLYDELWQLEENGEKLVGGHTTADGQMAILNYTGLTTEDLADRIDRHLQGDFEVFIGSAYSAFPTKEEYNYDSETIPEGQAAGWASIQRDARGLRDEATALLQKELEDQGEVRSETPREQEIIDLYEVGDITYAELQGALAKLQTLASFDSNWARTAPLEEIYNSELLADAEAQVDAIPLTDPNAPERQDAQLQTAAKVLEDQMAAHEIKAEKKVWFVMGPPASGKSSYIEGETGLAARRGALVVDSDMAKELIPELAGGIGANAVHEESKKIGEIILDTAISRGLNIVEPLVGKNYEKMRKRIQAYRDLGYTVGVRLVDLPIEKTFRRAVSRYIETGRFIPSDYIFKAVGYGPAETYIKIAEQGDVDDIKAFDADVPKGERVKPLSSLDPLRGRVVPQIQSRPRSSEAVIARGEEARGPSSKAGWSVLALSHAPEARKKRLREQGFDTSKIFYHATQARGVAEDFDFFTPTPERPFVFVSEDPNFADKFNDDPYDDLEYLDYARIIPLYIKAQKTFDFRDITPEQEASLSSFIREAEIQRHMDIWKEMNSPSFRDDGYFIEDQGLPDMHYEIQKMDEAAAREEVESFVDEVAVRNVISQIKAGNWKIIEPELDYYYAGGRRKDTNVLDWMKSEGYDSFTVEEFIPGAGRQTTLALLNPNQVRSVHAQGYPALEGSPNLLAQTKKGRQRGAISFTEQGGLMSLFENADLSTVLHESGHFFFQMYTEFAKDSPEIAADVQALLDHIGVKDLETWQSMSLEEQREGHELIARSFEAYMFEGKAPSIGLQKYFDKFRSWLVSIYRELRNLNAPLNDDIRGVFDRMLATEDEIRAKQVAAGYTPLFGSIEESGMTEAQWAKYQALNEVRQRRSESALARRSLKDMQWLDNAKSRLLREMQAEHKQIRSDMRDQVASEVAREPVYYAMHFLRTGETVDADGNPVTIEAHKLDRDEFHENYPNIKLPRGMTEKDGVPADMLAESLGWESGDAMVQAILRSEPQKERIDRLTDERMIQEHGDLGTPEKMMEAVNEALHSEAHIRFLHTELTHLTKSMGDRNVLNRAAKAFAAQAIGRKKVRDIKPHKFTQAADRAGRNAQRSLREGDRESAVEHKRAQVLNVHFFRAANQAKKDVEKAVRYFKKFSRPGTRKNLDPDYLDRIDELLEKYDLRQASLKEIDRRKSYAEWLKEQHDMGFDPIVDERLAAAAKRQHFKDTPVDEMRALYDSIKNIEHLGRMKKRLLRARKQMQLDEAAGEIADRIGETPKEKSKVKLESNTAWDKVKEGWRDYFAMHRKFSSFARMMDGHEYGPMWEHFIRGMNAAGDMETEMRAEATRDLSTIFKPLEKKNIRKKEYIPSLGQTMSLEGRLAVVLNMGNAGNKQRLENTFTPQQQQEILDSLTKEEMDFVQQVWDYIDTYWDEIAAKSKRLTGTVPQKVEGEPLVTRHGTYDGGYYPIVYDHRKSDRASGFSQADLMEQAKLGKLSRATTRRGHEEQRKAHVGLELNLTLNPIFSHVDQVIHDLSWHEWLIDANRLRSHPLVDKAIREKYGPEVARAIKDTFDDIAAGPVPAQNAFERFTNRIRTGATIAGMGYSLWTSLLQPLGLTQSIARIGPKYVGLGLAEWLGDAARMENTVKQINEKSKFMRDRSRTLQREVNEIMNRVEPGMNKSALTASYFYLIQKVQLVADVPTWLGQYHKSIDQGVDEDTAIAQADQAVIDTQSSGHIKDLAKIQRGSPYLKLFTNFYSYFSALWQLTSESFDKNIRNYKHPGDIGRFAVDMILLYSVPATLSALMREALTGRCDGDEECVVDQVIAENLGYMVGPLVGPRELSGALAGFYNYSGPPGLRFYSEMAKLAKQTAQGDVDAAWLRAANQVVGTYFHLPATQMQRTAEGLYAIWEGDVEGVEAVKAPLFGPPR